MKINTIWSFVGREEIIDYVGSLWRTPEFQASHSKEGGYIRKLIEKFADVPRFFFEMSDPALESSHFSSWWNAISLRHYENDAISDLYYLHEIWHAATMEYDENMTWDEWFRKMGENELEASIQSEVMAHFYLPGIREKSFAHKIWADRFLAQKSPGEFEAIYRQVKEARIRVMHSPNPYDFIELQIANYGRQNLEWSIMWKDDRRIVERHMREFMELARIDREGAAKMHEEWLVVVAMGWNPDNVNEWLVKAAKSIEPGSHIPFRERAVEFSALAAENKRKYGNHLLT